MLRQILQLHRGYRKWENKIGCSVKQGVLLSHFTVNYVKVSFISVNTIMITVRGLVNYVQFPAYVGHPSLWPSALIMNLEVEEFEVPSHRSIITMPNTFPQVTR